LNLLECEIGRDLALCGKLDNGGLVPEAFAFILTKIANVRITGGLDDYH
jgi:hypothetical protein